MTSLYVVGAAVLLLIAAGWVALANAKRAAVAEDDLEESEGNEEDRREIQEMRTQHRSRTDIVAYARRKLRERGWRPEE